MSYKKEVGNWGETQSCGFLERRGFEIVDRNFCAGVGEIDIVAQKGDDFYFVEVKTRTQEDLANDQSITNFKVKKLQKAVKKYCYVKNIEDLGLILAGLVVFVDTGKKTVKFSFMILDWPKNRY